MLNRSSCHTPNTQSGVALLEALIAVLIFSLGILAVVGLQANAMRITTDAKMRIDASNVANQRVGEMWADPTNLAGHAVADLPISDLPDGKMTVAVAADVVTVTVTWKVSGSSDTQRYVSTTRINPNP
jgi:type IV pilus assembly protein PilV